VGIAVLKRFIVGSHRVNRSADRQGFTSRAVLRPAWPWTKTVIVVMSANADDDDDKVRLDGRAGKRPTTGLPTRPSLAAIASFSGPRSLIPIPILRNAFQKPRCQAACEIRWCLRFCGLVGVNRGSSACLSDTQPPGAPSRCIKRARPHFGSAFHAAIHSPRRV
jgi:hypothetical protein